MSRFLRQELATLKPYTPGEQPKDTGRLIKLNTNENPYGPAPGVLEVINAGEAEKLRLYSEPDASVFTQAVADFYGLDRDQVIAGNGSDEILAFIFMAFRGKNGRVWYPEISYSFYPVYCDIFGAEGVEVSLAEDFSVRPEDYYDADGTIVITNPNAPTGMALELSQIEEILKHNGENLVVIDEAYVDFGADSATALIDRYDNLLVVQTLSKSRSLAGARVGFAMGNRDIIADMNRIKFSFNPYNLNRLSILAGAEAMKDREYFDMTRNRIIDTRENFVEEMKAMGFDVLPSKANFVFISGDRISGEEYFEKLRKYNIIVRHFKGEKIREYVRITIGTPQDMERLVEVTGEILQDAGRQI